MAHLPVQLGNSHSRGNEISCRGVRGSTKIRSFRAHSRRSSKFNLNYSFANHRCRTNRGLAFSIGRALNGDAKFI